MNESNLIAGHLPCSDCGSSDAYSTYDDGHGYCFSCKTWFPPPKNKRPDQKGVYTFEYVPWRGIKKSTMEFFGVKTAINADGEPVRIDAPFANGSFQFRDLSQKRFWTQDGPNGERITDAGLFGRDKFSAAGGRSVTVTEAWLDALSLWQVLGENPAYAVCSVQSSTLAHRDCALDRAWLNSFEKVYLCFDGDEPGRRACNQVARLFNPSKVYNVKLTKRKDANEYLEAGEGDVLKKIWWNSGLYLPDNILSTLTEFKEVLSTETAMGAPYPWKKLTDMTFGMRMGESVLVTAQEKVGKTEIFHFIEHKLLTETQDNVATFFYEEQPKRHLQALVSIELGQQCHLPTSTVSVVDRELAIEQVVGRDGRLFITDKFGSVSPDVLLDHIRYLVTAHNVKYVLFDNITISVTGLGEKEERITLDYLSTKLEMLAKELDFCLLFISHLNDEGQTRGSRNLGKVCDVRIDITRNLQATDPVEKRTWSFNLAYARLSGKSGPAGKAVFDQDTYSFVEVFEADNDNGQYSLRSAA